MVKTATSRNGDSKTRTKMRSEDAHRLKRQIENGDKPNHESV